MISPTFFKTRPFRAERSSSHVNWSCQTSSKERINIDEAGSFSDVRSMSTDERSAPEGGLWRFPLGGWRRRERRGPLREEGASASAATETAAATLTTSFSPEHISTSSSGSGSSMTGAGTKSMSVSPSSGTRGAEERRTDEGAADTAMEMESQPEQNQRPEEHQKMELRRMKRTQLKQPRRYGSHERHGQADGSASRGHPWDRTCRLYQTRQSKPATRRVAGMSFVRVTFTRRLPSKSPGKGSWQLRKTEWTSPNWRQRNHWQHYRALRWGSPGGTPDRIWPQPQPHEEPRHRRRCRWKQQCHSQLKTCTSNVRHHWRGTAQLRASAYPLDVGAQAGQVGQQRSPRNDKWEKGKKGHQAVRAWTAAAIPDNDKNKKEKKEKRKEKAGPKR